jgi:hypothetical protein
MTTNIEQLINDIVEVYEDEDDGFPRKLAEGLVALGWVKLPGFVEHPPLRDYKVGERVYVLREGDSIPGQVSELTSFGVQVDTARGPVTIAHTRAIKKIATI